MFDYSKLSNMADNFCGSGMKCIPWIDWIDSVDTRLEFRLFFPWKITPFWLGTAFSHIDSAIFDCMVNQVVSFNHVGKTPYCHGHQPIIIRFLQRVVRIEFRKFLRVVRDNDFPLIPTNYDRDGWRQNGFLVRLQFGYLELVSAPRCTLELS